MIDSHIHLTHRKFDNVFPYLQTDPGFSILTETGNRTKVIAALKEAGVSFVVEPAIDLKSNEKILALARKENGFVLPAVGVHPTRTYAYQAVRRTAEGVEKAVVRLLWADRKKIASYAKDPQVAAIGETGLDYHLKRDQQHRFRQTIWFLWQLELAHRHRLPVILHVREADRDAIRILRLFRRRIHGGVCHCFRGGPDLANAYTALGLMLGIGGSLLTNHAGELEEAIRQTPLEHLLLETDGPYVKPTCPELTQKQRYAARNTSLILPGVIRRIAELKGVPYEAVEQITDENAKRLFRKR